MRSIDAATFALCLMLFSCGAENARTGSTPMTQRGSALEAGSRLDWSRSPPDALHPLDTPQFVAVTFDDNFVSGLGDATGGVTWATDFFRELVNPAGKGLSATYDGAPVRTSFFSNCYIIDGDALSLEAWTTVLDDGHEMANHTWSHGHGAEYSLEQWQDEIGSCNDKLIDAESGLGMPSQDLLGFRAPYLAYNADMFTALASSGLAYDTTLQSCWAADEDGSNCAFPYTLDMGSQDAEVLAEKFADLDVAPPEIGTYPGLWEMPVSALIVPPDEVAAEYGFAPGLRGRIPDWMPEPSYYEEATGKIAPLDHTLFVDAQMSAAEVLATLKYSLDLHLEGNRAPLIVVGHTHIYASNFGAAPNAGDVIERQQAIEAFVEYALSKSVVRMRPVKDILRWMKAPEPLNGVRTVDAGSGDAGATDAADAGSVDAAVADASPADAGVVDASPPDPTAKPRRNPGGSCSLAGPVSNTSERGLELLVLGLLGVAFLRRAARPKLRAPTA